MAVATLEQILDELNEYSDFEEVRSAPRARKYITAARRFLALPSSSSEQGSALGYTPDMIRREMEIARAIVRAEDGSTAGNTSVRFLSARRGYQR